MDTFSLNQKIFKAVEHIFSVTRLLIILLRAFHGRDMYKHHSGANVNSYTKD